MEGRSWQDILEQAPQAWARLRLDQVFEERSERGRDDLPLLSVTGDRGVLPRDELERRDTSSSDKSKYLRVAPGDLAYNTMRMWQGVSGISALEGLVSPAYTVCALRDSHIPNYMGYLCKLPQLVGRFGAYSQGIVSDTWNLRFCQFGQIVVPVPPPGEQERIAAIISSVDDMIRATRKVIEQTKRTKQGLLQTLMTRGIGHTRLMRTEIGEIPEGWEVCTLGDVLDGIEGGRSPVASEHPAEAEKWGVLKVSAIGDGRFFPANNKALPDGYRVEPSHQVKPGDVLISRANTPELVGATCRVPSGEYRLMLSDKTLRLKPNLKRITPAFLAEIANAQSSRMYFAHLATGSSASMKNLSRTKIRSLPIALPPLAEVQSLETVLDNGRRALEAEEAHTAGLQTLKRDLLQDLITGRVRVPLD